MAKDLTQAEKATNSETMKHILQVQYFIIKIIEELNKRGLAHDRTKLDSPEVEMFTKYTPKLAKTEYGSEEYTQFLKELKPALDHHYAKNRHHPEHYPDSVNGMNLVDIIEMLCDWKAATYRQHNGNILQSIEKNKERFGLSDQLAQILQNTVEYFDMSKDN
jgi:hypothetical protein